MEKSSILKSILLILALAAFGSLVLFVLIKIVNKPNTVENTQNSVSTTVVNEEKISENKEISSKESFGDKEKTAELVKFREGVYYKLPNQTVYELLSEDSIKLPSKSYIKTEEGKAHVILPDNSLISVDKNTEMEIIFKENSTTISQIIGNTWHRIKKLAGSDDYNVETPTAIASVRGTKFLVAVQEEESSVYVTEGNINISQTEIFENKRIIRQEQEISAGQKALIPDISKKQLFQIQKITETDPVVQSEFFKENRILDIKYDETPDNILENIRLRKLELNETVTQGLKTNLEMDALKGLRYMNLEVTPEMCASIKEEIKVLESTDTAIRRTVSQSMTEEERKRLLAYLYSFTQKCGQQEQIKLLNEIPTSNLR